MTKKGNAQLQIKRTIHAEPKTVYHALVNEEKLSQWFYPKPDGWSVKVDFSGKKGDSYNLTMVDPEGKEYVHAGEIKEAVANKKLLFTWNTEHVQNSMVTITLKKVNGGTEVTLLHEFLPADMEEGHRKGWIELFEQLTKLLSTKNTGDLNVG